MATAKQELAASGVACVEHDDNADIERPAGFATVIWIGTVEPDAAVDGDIWINTEG